MNQYSLCTLDDLSVDTINEVLELAQAFNDTKKDWQFNSTELIANLFFEPSTRTHYSFVSAQLQLGAKSVDINIDGCSLTKGESLNDTVKTLEAIGYSAVVIRHPDDEYYKDLMDINIPLINAGDGCGNHPTQCLLDLLTIKQEFKSLRGVKVAVIGDINHSRVANTMKQTIKRLKGHYACSGPKEWVSDEKHYMDIDEAIKWADVVMMLRIQNERHLDSDKLSEANYLKHYGLSNERYKLMKDHAIIMHPAPVNRGVEIADELVECAKSRIFKQMQNGVLIRKAVLTRALKKEVK